MEGAARRVRAPGPLQARSRPSRGLVHNAFGAVATRATRELLAGAGKVDGNRYGGGGAVWTVDQRNARCVRAAKTDDLAFENGMGWDVAVRPNAALACQPLPPGKGEGGHRHQLLRVGVPFASPLEAHGTGQSRHASAPREEVGQTKGEENQECRDKHFMSA